MDIEPLDSFGRRIMICGPSNSGKSTLAAAIGRKLDLPVVHLDRLHHLPNSDWVKRPHDDFVRLHDAAIAGEAWVMEGNYSSLFPQRFARHRHHPAQRQSLGQSASLYRPHPVPAPPRRRPRGQCRQCQMADGPLDPVQLAAQRQALPS
jgi:hypothetical protein